MSNHRLYNKRKFKRTVRRIISPPAQKRKAGNIVNSEEETVDPAAIVHEHWVFSYLLCNPNWQGTGIFANDFSDVFNTSGSLLDFITEFQNHTIRNKAKNCLRTIKRFGKKELMN
jgi:hypothetical protein